MKCWLPVWLLLVVFAVAADPFATDDPQVAAAVVEAGKYAAGGQWPQALEAGDRLRKLCHEKFGDEHPNTAQAELFLGEVRDHLGELPLAEAHFLRALAIQEKALAPDAPELAVTITRLAACLKSQQRLDEAVGLLQRALDLQVKIHGPDDVETAAACTNLARVLRLKSDFAHALPLLERALSIDRRQLGGFDRGTIAALRELADAREASGDLAGAEQTAAERAVACEAQFGAKSVELFGALSDWGRLAERQENFTAAEPRYRRALAVAEIAFADEPVALANGLMQLGGCLRSLNRPDEALPLLQRALDLRLHKLGEANADVAESEREVGWIYRLKRDFTAALPYFEMALAVREHAFEPNDPQTLESLAELGDLQWLRGAYDEAAKVLEKRRDRTLQVGGDAATAWHSLAIVYESAKRWPEATKAAQSALEASERQRGTANRQTIEELMLLARVCAEAGDFTAARAGYARLDSWFEQHPDSGAKEHAELLRQFAIATLRAGREDEAAALFRASQRVHEAAYGANDPETLRSIGDLWTYFDETHQPAAALDVAKDLAARTEAVFGAETPPAIAVFDRVGQLELTLGDRAAAMQWFRRALEARRRHFGEGSPELLDALAQTAAWLEGAGDVVSSNTLRTERLGAIGHKFGPASNEVIEACGELALGYFRQHDYAAARGLFDHQLSLVSKNAGPDSEAALTIRARLGDVAAAAGDWPQAVSERELLAAGCVRHYGADHRESGRAALLLGEALLFQGDEARAASVLAEAKRSLPAAEVSRADCGLARAALKQRDFVAARKWTEVALAAPANAAAPVADAFARLGEELDSAGESELADAALSRSVTILQQLPGTADETSVAADERLGRLRLRAGRGDAAEWFERALNASDATNGTQSAESARLLGWLSLAQAAQQHWRAALDSAERMNELARDAFAGADPQLALAPELRAWAQLHLSDTGHFVSTAKALADLEWNRWSWLQPAASELAHTFAGLTTAVAERSP